MSNKAIKAQYQKNEHCNAHADNYILLAKHFGSEKHKFYARVNKEYELQFGYGDHDLGQICYERVGGLYIHLRHIK
jgi:hypothetical protein